MSIAERVTIREYDSAEDAKAAEALLFDSGLSADIVSRSGNQIRVVPGWENDARSVLDGSGTGSGSSITTAAGKVKNAASSAKESVQSTASTATDRAQQTASSAVDKVQNVAGAASEQVDKTSNAAASQVETLADAVRRRGDSPSAPALQRRAAHTTAGALDKTSQYLRQGSLRVVLADLSSVVRRNPGRSLLAGLGLGYLVVPRLFPGAGSSAAASVHQHSQSEVITTHQPAAEIATAYQPTPEVLPVSQPIDVSVTYTSSPEVYASSSDADVSVAELDSEVRSDSSSSFVVEPVTDHAASQAEDATNAYPERTKY